MSINSLELKKSKNYQFQLKKIKKNLSHPIKRKGKLKLVTVNREWELIQQAMEETTSSQLPIFEFKHLAIVKKRKQLPITLMCICSLSGDLPRVSCSSQFRDVTFRELKIVEVAEESPRGMFLSPSTSSLHDKLLRE